MISCSCCCWTELEHFRKCVRGISTGISQNTHKSLFSSISILLFSFLWADCFAFLSLALFSFISVILCLGFVMCRHQICRQYNTIGWHSFSVVCRRRCRHRRRVFISFLIGSMWWVCLLFTICYWKCIDSVFSSSHFFAHFFFSIFSMPFIRIFNANKPFAFTELICFMVFLVFHLVLLFEWMTPK